MKDNYKNRIKASYQIISVKNYSYNLPPVRIAKYPLDKRDESKLLILKTEGLKKTFLRTSTNILIAEVVWFLIIQK